MLGQNVMAAEYIVEETCLPNYADKDQQDRKGTGIRYLPRTHPL
jgi:hypothetical protein